MSGEAVIVPNELIDVLSLAGIIIFFITSCSAVLSSVFVKRDNLFYLGTQVILLAIFLRLAAHWTYPLWFSAMFGGVEQQIQFIMTLLLLAIAYTLDMGLRVFVWEGYLARHGQRSVPPLLIASARVIIYMFALLMILQFVFDKPITALAALSGAMAVILGLSAQATLGEIFAGIALALSRPFRIGDWVQIGTLEEGRVLDMTWRMVTVETRDRVVLCVPNRSAADQTVRNFSYPNPAVCINETIWFPHDQEPTLIQGLLVRAMADTPGVLSDPPPSALHRGAKDGVCEFTLRFYIDYADKETATEDVWKSVLDHIARSDFAISFPRRHLTIQTSAEPAQAAVAAEPTAPGPKSARVGSGC